MCKTKKQIIIDLVLIMDNYIRKCKKKLTIGILNIIILVTKCAIKTKTKIIK